MNILFVFYFQVESVETLACQRSYALKKHGINFHFLYFYEGSGVQTIHVIQTSVYKNKILIYLILCNKKEVRL